MSIFKRTFSQDLDLLKQHLTKDILSQTDCNTTLINLRTKFENAFNSEFKERMHKYTRFNAQSFQDAMICNMDSIGKYMRKIILHQQRTSHLLKKKKLMQTQEDHSNLIQALNSDSLKVDLVVMQNTYSEKEDTNSETASSKSVKESSLNSATKDAHAIKYKMSKAKERCMAYFRSLHSHLQVLSKEDLKGTRIKHGFKWAFMSLFGQDANTFTNKYFVKYTGIKVKHFKDTLLQHIGNVKKSVAERTRHQRQYNRRVNKRQLHMQESKIDTGKAVNDDLVVTKSSRTESKVQDDNSRSGNDTDTDNTDIRPIYDKKPMAEIQFSAECNIFAIGKHHTEQPEIINEGRADQYSKQCQAKSPMLDSSLDNQTTEYSKQSLEPQMSKPRFASQVYVSNNLSRPVTQHYLPKRRESISAKPDHMIASSESRDSSKNMPRFSSNDMVHNHYLEEARKKTQEINRNSKSSVMHTASPQNTTKGNKPKPRINNQTSKSLPVSKSSCIKITAVPKADHSKNSSSFSYSKHFVCSTCYKCVFNANHDACITKLSKEVNSLAMIQSHKTRNSNKLVDQKSHTQKHGRQIFIGHRFSPNKTFVVYEKTYPRSDLRWKPTGRILKSIGLRWIPTGKLFDSCTSKVDSEPPHGSNVDIPNIYECKQTLDASAGTSINVQKEQSLDLSAGTLCNANKENLRDEYDMWRIRIEQYFQVQDYALWDVIENENSFIPAAQTTTNADGKSTSLILGPITTEEKVQIKNDVNVRSMLLIALPNEHLMTFNQYKDAKTLFVAIQTRFGVVTGPGISVVDVPSAFVVV
nr:ribonuclease H-like domain-containing protein [Tanacetum cinerariifolium]